MKRVEAIIRPERLGEVASNLEAHGLAGFTISDVRGHGNSPERTGEYRGNVYEMLVTHKLAIALFVEDEEVDVAVAAISGGAHTGAVGDGIISVSEVAAVYRISGGTAAPDSAEQATTTD
jgi:nitrogen regulatory protein P-II 1